MTDVTHFQQLNGRAVDLLLYGDTHTIEREVREVRELVLAFLYSLAVNSYLCHDAATSFEENIRIWLHILKSVLLRRHGLFWK